MCGICGIISFDPEREVSAQKIQALTQSLRHRGPDDEGYLMERNIGLGHRRLSVIDLEGGHQPIYNEDRSVAVVFNGEIYNFPELREDLEKYSHNFKTHTDTETLVHGYEQWGIEGLLKKCNGMFAFALLDRKHRLLFLARDRLGKKPLYYGKTDHQFFFSSEIRGLINEGLIAKRIHPPSLNHYTRMQFSYGEDSLIQGVKRVLPGSFLRVDCQKALISRHFYWTLEKRRPPKGFTLLDYCSQLQTILKDSVRLRRISDVPVGTFLSGGVDSSIMTGLLAEWVHPLCTFSIGFEDAAFDESPHSRTVSSFYETRHHHFLLTGSRLVDLLPEIIHRLDEPVGDAALIPTYWLCKEARKTVTVVLTGEGADEIFAGYDYYKPFLNRPFNLRDRIGRRWKYYFCRPAPFNEYYGPPSELSGFPFALSEILQQRLLTPDYWDSDSLKQYYLTLLKSFRTAGANPLDQALMADIKSWLADDLLMKVDKMSMLNSLEARAPYLDYRLVEFALSIPNLYRISQGLEKYVLRETFQGFLPPEIITRKKQGFNLPMDVWIREDLSPLIHEHLSPGKIQSHGFFNPTVIGELIHMHNHKGARFERLLFSLLIFQMWWESLGTKGCEN